MASLGELVFLFAPSLRSFRRKNQTPCQKDRSKGVYKAMSIQKENFTLKVNQLALDSHTPERGTHYDGPWADVIKLVAESDDWKEGFAPGVREVKVDPAGFFAGIAKLNESSVLTATFAPRRKDEEPVTSIRTTPAGGKLPATSVVVFVYSREALGDEATTDADWEIASVQGDAGEGQSMDPVTMARNFLDLEGGTKGDFTAQDFAEAIIWASKHAVVG
jgi:hypothetical protein